jgi:uncharacterized cupin superfamily protein
VTLVHWDDVQSFDIPGESRPLAGTWQRLGDAAGSVGVGLQRVRVPEGALMTPPHVHSGEEEIVHVLGGRGTLWQDGRTCAVGAGDTVVFVAGGAPHTLVGGDGGLEVVVFGTRRIPETGLLPRTGRAWIGRNAFAVAEGSHPWTLEAGLGLPDGEPGDPPENLRRLDDAPSEYDGLVRYLAQGLAQRSGLNRLALPAGEEGAPPHCHSLEEELFVVLEGGGTLELWSRPNPDDPRQSAPAETHELRPGHVVSRPPGTRIPHSFRAGPAGMTYLTYGTREANDMCWYPRSNKVFLRGLGVIARLELLAYSDGEPS